MKLQARSFKTPFFLLVAQCLAAIQAAPLSTVQNSTLSVPASNVAAAGIPGATNLVGSNFLMSAITPATSRGGRAWLVNAQQWVSRLGSSPASFRSGGSEMVVRSDGSIVVAGNAYALTGRYNFLTLAYRPDGTPLWTNQYDGPAHGDERAMLVATSPNGDVWVAGQSLRYPTNYLLTDVAILKYASNGVPVWTNRYTSGETNGDTPNALAVDASGNAYLKLRSWCWPPSGNGFEVADAIIKYGPLGNPVRTNLYPVAGPDSGQAPHDAAAMALDQAGNLLVAGNAGTDYYLGNSLIKLAGDGTPLWTNYHAYKFIPSSKSLHVDGQGDIVLTGLSSSNASLLYVVLKCSSGGTSLWTNTMVGPSYDNGDLPQTLLDPAGNVLLIGGIPWAPGSGRYQMLRLSAQGVPLWVGYTADLGTNNVLLDGTAMDSAGNAYLAIQAPNPTNGTMDYVTLKYSSNGEAVWTNRYDGPADRLDYPGAVAVNGAGDVYVTGWSENPVGDEEATTVKYVDLLFYAPPKDFTGEDLITYVLTDNFGNSATGSVSMAVAQGAFGFNLSPLATKPTPGGFQLQVEGAPATAAVILQASTDLLHWQPILTNTPAGGTVQFLDSSALSNPQRFYRAVQSQ